MQVEQLIDSRILDYARIREQLAAVAGKIERAERNAARVRDEEISVVVRGSRADLSEGPIYVTGKATGAYKSALRSLDRLRKEYAHLDTAQWEALEAAEDAITAVPRSDIRLLLRLRFLDGMTWYDIAMKHGKTPTWPKITLERYYREQMAGGQLPPDHHQDG